MTLSQTNSDKDPFVQVGRYRIQIIRKLCIGAASCIAIAPETYELDDMAKAIIKNDGTDSPEDILMAAQACPTKAVVIVDTETGQQLWPVKKA
jgi:ferredoxin